LGELIRDTQGADRLSLTFRFKTGKADLDNLAPDNVKRVVEFMSRPENSGRALLLLGFSDSKGGNSKANCDLSQQRADEVARAVSAQGLIPALVRGYCIEAPVAWDDPDQKEGNHKNRRVEAWLR
jgi:phosphate transport system substrate-binding protein